jgi:hypothetical protein
MDGFMKGRDLTPGLPMGLIRADRIKQLAQQRDLLAVLSGGFPNPGVF